MLGETIGIIFGLLALLCIVLTAHYLSQIREILRDIQTVQKKVALRMGCSLNAR